MADTGEIEAGSGVRRVRLAAERTLLAWWRTGMAAVAVGLGVGRIVPEVSDATHRWPYVVLGVLFIAYGIALIAVGSHRVNAVGRAVEQGRYDDLSPAAIRILTASAIGLATLTAVVVVID